MEQLQTRLIDSPSSKDPQSIDAAGDALRVTNEDKPGASVEPGDQEQARNPTSDAAHTVESGQVLTEIGSSVPAHSQPREHVTELGPAELHAERKWLVVAVPFTKEHQHLLEEYCTELNRRAIWSQGRLAHIHVVARPRPETSQNAEASPVSAKDSTPPQVGSSQSAHSEDVCQLHIPVYRHFSIEERGPYRQALRFRRSRHAWDFRRYSILFEHPSNDGGDRKWLILRPALVTEWRDKLSSKGPKLVGFSQFELGRWILDYRFVPSFFPIPVNRS
ncbi:hypothetical protein QBC47DRAFT_378188 [Echria macrotheca]|uniref:Uncharacterized protein n=1 Tax=Echria macrotheca TaxID=438768 RepID=A0AAJ0F7L5_9PEZI|nr:hypothetical protein QBC47DRAFT_378188 [Echria macrotheca]